MTRNDASRPAGLGEKRKLAPSMCIVKDSPCTSVGKVQVVFSTMLKPQRGKRVEIQKVLMTNDLTLSAAQIVELYDLRWQIELFFKELKSTLGFHQLASWATPAMLPPLLVGDRRLNDGQVALVLHVLAATPGHRAASAADGPAAEHPGPGP